MGIPLEECRACFPASTSIAVSKPITVSSECGLSGRETVCNGANQCYSCDETCPFGETTDADGEVVCGCPSTRPVINGTFCCSGNVIDNRCVGRYNVLSHRKDFANDADTDTYYQSEQGASLPIDLTVDLLTEFEVSSIDVVFAGAVARSATFSRAQQPSNASDPLTFVPYQHFSADCSGVFGVPADGTVTAVNSVLCSSMQSYATEHQYNFRTLTMQRVLVGGSDFTSSPALQEYVKARHIRVSLAELFTPQNAFNQFGTLVLEVEPVARVADIHVEGRCQCNGHASQCVFDEDTGLPMCVCKHNTMGNNCEMCKPMFNAKPWAPATKINEPNICHRCNCNNHAAYCDYDRSLDRFPTERDRGDGSVCMDCLHGTTGERCELCQLEFYYNNLVDRDAIDACLPCDCHVNGSVSAVCDQDTGMCTCKANTFTRDCGQCVDGTYGIGTDAANGCSECGCVLAGTESQSNVCNKQTGQCPCLDSNTGRNCSECVVGFFHPPSGIPGECVACDDLCSDERGCNAMGSTLSACNGKCRYVELDDECVEQCPNTTHYTSNATAASGQENDLCVLCDPQCDGGCVAGGPSTLACNACANFEFNSTCVAQCPPQTYPDDNNVCQPCDRRCNNCTGPANTECMACVDVRRGSECLDACPLVTYESTVQGERVCLDCNAQCSSVSRCSGPGTGQCEFCGSVYLPTFDVTRPYPPVFLPYSFRCLPSCPPFFFVSDESYTNRLTKESAILPICRPCDSQCAQSCDGILNTDCIGACKFAISGSACVSACPMHTYPAVVAGEPHRVCSPCDASCDLMDGCIGPGNDDCVSCSDATLNYNGVCLDSCPSNAFEDARDPSGQRICTDCDPACANCTGSSNSQCPACVEFAFGDACVEECPAGHYAVPKPAGSDGPIAPKQCVPCNSECDPLQSCRSGSARACDACANVLLGDTCVSQCPLDRTFEDDTRTCVDCDPECDGGCSGPTARECVRCKYASFNGTCVADCPLDTVFVNGLCMPCHGLCETDAPLSVRACSALGPFNCTACDRDEAFFNTLTGACVLECPSTTTYSDSNRDCQLCDAQCSGGCTGGSARDCNRCRNFKLVDACVATCPPNFYVDGAVNECRQCDAQCRFGCTGPLPTQCTNPAGAETPCLNRENVADGRCVAVCDMSLTFEEGVFCVPCNDECDLQGCVGANSTECFGCANVALGSDCVSECPHTHYADVNSVCQQCDAECTSRVPAGSFCRGGTATDCVACANFLRGDTCVPACTQSEIVVGNECITCDPQCGVEGCFGSLNTECLACQNSYDLGSCVSDCNEDAAFTSPSPPTSGSVIRAASYCLPCHSECDTSAGSGGCPTGTSSSDCVRCSHVRAVDGSCIGSCPVGSFTNTSDTGSAVGGACEACHSSCAAEFGCSGPTASDCGQCASGLSHNGACVDTCPPFTFDNGGECTGCDFNCLDGCFGPAADQCTREPFPMVTTAQTLGCRFTALVVDVSTISCQMECPISTYEDANGICRQCSSFCARDLGCIGPGQLNCNPCDAGDFVTSERVCEACSSACNTTATLDSGYACSGPTAADCAACAEAYFDGACVVGGCGSLNNIQSGEYFYRDTTPSNPQGPTCKLCDSQCAPGGCTGGANTDCTNGCRQFSLMMGGDGASESDVQCVSSCDPLATYITDMPQPNTCRPCHPECFGGCTGGSPSECQACARLRLANGTCVGACPNGLEPDGNGVCECPEASKFLRDSDGECVACSPLCTSGCTGETAGDCANGAQGCTVAQLNGACVAACPTNMEIGVDRECVCRAGFYPEYDGSNVLTGCSPCHATCALGDRCTGPTSSDCRTCQNFRTNGQCVNTCPANQYGDVVNKVCQPCGSQCAGGCTRPLDNTRCVSCALYRETGLGCVDHCSAARSFLFNGQCLSACPTSAPFYNDTRIVDRASGVFVTGLPSLPQACVDSCSVLTEIDGRDRVMQSDEDPLRCQTPSQQSAEVLASQANNTGGIDDLYLALLIAGVAFVLALIIGAVYFARRSAGYQVSPSAAS